MNYPQGSEGLNVNKSTKAVKKSMDIERQLQELCVGDELPYEEILDYLGGTATNLLYVCADKGSGQCAVFETINLLYLGHTHRASVASDLIYTKRLNVSECNKNFCLLKSIQRNIK
jgi:hypothetical protein